MKQLVKNSIRCLLIFIVAFLFFVDAPAIFAATFFNQQCINQIVHGRAECVGYFTGNNKVKEGGIPVFPMPSLTDVYNRTTFINNYQQFLYNGSEQEVVGAAATINIMLGQPGTAWGNNKSAGIQYAKDNFTRWTTLVQEYDNRGLVDWDYNYNPFGLHPNSGWGQNVKDAYFQSSETTDTVLVIRFRNPNGNPNDAFYIDKWCGNVKGDGFIAPIVNRISGNVFVDINRNGIKDTGETNYQGVTITRTGPSSGSTTTDASGNYVFTNLTSGTYTTSISVPTGYINTTPISQSDTLGPDATSNFGIAPNYTISGIVFTDSNLNGVQDSGETTENGIQVQLQGAASRTTTSGTGGYTFANLLAGNYTVSITVPNSYLTSTPTSAATTLGPNRTIHFGVSPNYTISGNLFIDANNNALKDTGEANYDTRPGITSSRGTVTVNSDGSYQISNLTAGTVTVSMTNLPSDYYLTTPLNGPPPSYQVVVGPGCDTRGAKGALCQ